MLEPNIRAMLEHSPKHRQEFTEALERIPRQDVALMAYTAGKTAKRLGITDMPNPYRGAEDQEIWAQWFSAGHDGGHPPPPIVPAQVSQATRGMSMEERREVFRNQFGIALPPSDGLGGRRFIQMARDIATGRRT